MRGLIAYMVLTVGWTALSGGVWAVEKRPNIILFLADDLGWTGLRCFGSDLYETPNLDELAASGMKFTDAYSACTVCSPSRAALMTGMYPAKLRLTSFIPGQDRPYAKMSIPDWTKGLGESYTTIAEALKEGGYRTWHVGKWHLNFPNEVADPTKHGFDYSEDKSAGTKGYFLSEKEVEKRSLDSNYLTDHLAKLAVQKIEEESADPFFLYFAFHVPHTPIQGRKDLVEYFEGKRRDEALHKNPTYAAMVKSMDMAVGRVLEAIQARGLEEETLVIFTSDNGGLTQRYGKHDNFTENLPLRRGKGSAFEGGVRVPTIVRWPGVIKAGSVCEEPICGVDFYPTLLEAAGAPGEGTHNAKVDGKSVVSLLRDPESSLERDLFWHFPHYHAGGDSPYTAIRSGNWRLVEFHENGALELYDLSSDLGETKNRATSHPEIASELYQRLNIWRDRVGAQMPKENAGYDPERATEVTKKKRK